MDKLDEARLKINEVDRKMAELFEERMEAVKQVANYKLEKGLPIYDASREEAVVKKNSEYVSDLQLRNFYTQFIQSVMSISRLYQHTLIKGARIAYTGVEGAFANIAARRLFPDGQMHSYASFADAYEAVVVGDCECAVLPIENSYAGEVGAVQDLMFSGSLYINGVYDLPIVQNLLAIKGSKIEDIEKVISHPQALAQCAEYIKKHHFDAQEATNTAVAASQVASLNDKHVAAIASLDTAELYDLAVLDHDINESSTNTTRFAVFSKVKNERVDSKDNCFILLFTVNNTAGSLAKAIDIIGKYGFNMRVLRSRPMKSLAWNYYFYVEAEGDYTSTNGQCMLKELSSVCDKLKVVGNYSTSITFETLKGENQ